MKVLLLLLSNLVSVYLYSQGIEEVDVVLKPINESIESDSIINDEVYQISTFFQSDIDLNDVSKIEAILVKDEINDTSLFEVLNNQEAIDRNRIVVNGNHWCLNLGEDNGLKHFSLQIKFYNELNEMIKALTYEE